MSAVTRANVYDYVNRAVLDKYPDAYVSGRYEPVPAGFPSVCIREISNPRREQNVTFSGEQGVRHSTFEVQVQTNSENSSLEEAEEIMDDVILAFQKLFYINTATNVLEDGERGIFRLVGTFRRIIGSADQMPEIEETTDDP